MANAKNFIENAFKTLLRRLPSQDTSLDFGGASDAGFASADVIPPAPTPPPPSLGSCGIYTAFPADSIVPLIESVTTFTAPSTIVLTDDHTLRFAAGTTFAVNGSTSNDGVYNATGSVFGSGKTTITVEEATVTSEAAVGNVHRGANIGLAGSLGVELDLENTVGPDFSPLTVGILCRVLVSVGTLPLRPSLAYSPQPVFYPHPRDPKVVLFDVGMRKPSGTHPGDGILIYKVG